MIDFLAKEWLKKPRKILGIMTGTSIDAIDLALVEIHSEKKFELIETGTELFPKEFKKYLIKLISNKYKAKEFSQLNSLYTDFLIDAIRRFSLYSKSKFDTIDVIAFHGQTIWHNPKKEYLFEKEVNSTWQIGDPTKIANYFNKTVINNFRSADIALGGEAAPLVPIFDYHFLRSKEKDVICLNIGGMSNLTFLKKNCSEDEVIAWDTGPGNVLIDKAAKKLLNKEYDLDGAIAAKGNENSKLFNFLNKIEYTYKKPPKSTGRELFDNSLFKKLIQIKKNENINSLDFITTLTKFTAFSISYNIKNYANENALIYHSGGGGKNKTLIRMLGSYLPNSTIIDTDSKHISSTFKESIAFAYIAWRSLSGLHSNIPSVTGAKRKAILGSITFAKEFNS